MTSKQLTQRSIILESINHIGENKNTSAIDRDLLNLAWWAIYALGVEHKENSLQAMKHALDSLNNH